MRLLQRHERAQHIEHVQQFIGVFGAPIIWLNFARGRKLATFADDRAITVFFFRKLNYCVSTCLPETSYSQTMAGTLSI